MNNGCCSKCQAKSKKTKKSKKLKEESDEEDVKQKQKVTEKEGNPKTDSNEDKGSHGTSDDKDKKKKNIVTWQHTSTKKDKGHGQNLSIEKNGINPPCFAARSMMYNGGPNPSNRWSISAPPRGYYPAFSRAPMYGPYGGGGGPFQPYQSMTPATMYNGAHISPYPYNGAHISPYPHMAAPIFPPYESQNRPFMDANPVTRYTTYRDNYSYLLL